VVSPERIYRKRPCVVKQFHVHASHARKDDFMLWKMPRLLLCIFVLLSAASGQSTRHFTFHYGFTVKNLPPRERVRIWIPAAHSDAFQEVKVISAKGDLSLKKTRDSEFGNEIYYGEASKNKQPELHFEIVYDVVRHEHLTLGIYLPHLAAVTLSPKETKRYLAPDALVPVTGLPAELAAKVTTGQSSPLEKARAIYDYVFANMRYDKTAATCSTPAMPRKAIAQIFTPYL
jgi:hypothetical protein